MSPPTEIEKLEDLIKDSVVGELVEQKVEPLVGTGENFGSVIYKVDFKVKNGDKEETYNAVAKCTPTNKVTQEMFKIQVTIKAEIALYTTIVPTIRDFQRESGVKEEADFFQHFYGARISLDPNSDIVDINSVILTENLKPLGYNILDRHVGFDLKTSKAILRDIATFHAVPIAIKIKNKELFETNIKPYLHGLEPLRVENPLAKDQNLLTGILKGLKEIPEIIPYVDRVSTNIEKYKLGEKSSTVREPWGTINHNDFWLNNIMIKEGDNPKTKFLDFQTTSYGSVATDVVFFLVVSVAQDVIEESMDELIKYYWNQFLKNLKQLNINDPSFTYEEFLKEIDEAASTGQFSHAIFMLYVMLADQGQVSFDSSNENFKVAEFFEFDFPINNRQKDKYRWLVSEFVKRGWI